MSKCYLCEKPTDKKYNTDDLNVEAFEEAVEDFELESEYFLCDECKSKY